MVRNIGSNQPHLAQHKHLHPLRRIFAMFLCLALLAGLFPILPLSQAVAQTTLPAPASINLSVDNWNRIRVEWPVVPGATGYLLQRRHPGETTFGTVVVAGASTTHHIDFVQNGQLPTYRIAALSAGTPGVYRESAPASMLWPVGIGVLPVGPDRMEISWTLPSNAFFPPGGYTPVIERRLIGGAWQLAGRAAAGASTFLDVGLSEGTRYEYRVRFDTGLPGTPLWYPTGSGIAAWTRLAAPGTLEAELLTTGLVRLSWNAPGELAAYSQIERSTNGGVYTLIGTVLSTSRIFSDANVTNGQVYRYRIRHMNAGSVGDWSQEARVLLVYPTQLTADAVYHDQINLTWSWPDVDPVALGEVRPRIERRKTGAVDWHITAFPDAGTDAWRDQELEPDTRYQYRIQAVYPDGGTSPWFPTSGQGYEIRTGIRYEVSFTGHAISATLLRLEWDLAALAGRTAVLERYDAAGVPVAVLQSASESSWIDTGLLPGTDYTYQLRVLAASGLSSAVSPPLTIRTEPVPAPESVMAVPAAADRVVITWAYGYAQESGFEVWRKTTGTWERIGETGRNIHYFTDTALPENGTAQWKVRATRGVNAFSAFSLTEIRPLGAPALPTSFTGLLNLARLTLSWTNPLPDMGPEVAYYVESRSGLNEPWLRAAEASPGSTSVNWLLRQHGEQEFRLHADVKGLSVYSGPYTHTGRAPATPKNLRSTATGSRQVLLAWDPPEETITWYRVYRTDGTRRLLAQISGSSLEYADATVTPGSNPQYALVARNAHTTSGEALFGPVSIPRDIIYDDLGNHGWASVSISRLTAMGIVSGTAPNRFSPARGLTRATYLKMLLSTLNIGTAMRPVAPIADVSAEDWHAPWMYAALTHGLLKPDSSGRLYPNALLTRAEMAAYTFEACLMADWPLALFPESVLDMFSDAADIPGPYRGAMTALVGNGLLTGRGAGTLSPNAGLTRAEAAVLLDRLLQNK